MNPLVICCRGDKLLVVWERCPVSRCALRLVFDISVVLQVIDMGMP
jgi:hypothetical protein